jgi:hypothetical protein
MPKPNKLYFVVKATDKNCQTTLNPAKQQKRWKEELNTGIMHWDQLYNIPLSCIENSFILQYLIRTMNRLIE